MNRFLSLFSAALLLSVVVSSCSDAPSADEDLRAHAEALAQEFIIVDGHVDVPYRLVERYDDISQRTDGGDFDYPRAKAGGLDAPFMSIYTPSDLQHTGGSKAMADSLIDMVEGFAEQWPDKFALVSSVQDVRSNKATGLISLPMGMENGAPIEDDLANLKYFYDRGIRYITLTHGEDNLIGDSSYDTTRTWNGMSDYGREVVKEMNRLGIMVDISHVSDSTFYDVMEVTAAPAIASHSSVRAFTPGFERNMNDDLIKRLAENGGVIMINFGSSFLSGELTENMEKLRGEIMTFMRENNVSFMDSTTQAFMGEIMEGMDRYADISDVIAHVNHVVELVGVDHVGLGSDFDGVGDSLPTGLKDVSQYPNLVYELLKAGYSDVDVQKILGENALRVWERVEEVSREMKGEPV